MSFSDYHGRKAQRRPGTPGSTPTSSGPSTTAANKAGTSSQHVRRVEEPRRKKSATSGFAPPSPQPLAEHMRRLPRGDDMKKRKRTTPTSPSPKGGSSSLSQLVRSGGYVTTTVHDDQTKKSTKKKERHRVPSGRNSRDEEDALYHEDIEGNCNADVEGEDDGTTFVRMTPEGQSTSGDLDSALLSEDPLEQRVRCLIKAFQPTPQDLHNKRQAILAMERCIANTPLEADLFGSGRTGLSLPKSDLDFCIYVKPPTAAPEGGSQGASERSGTPMGGLFKTNACRAFMSRRDRSRQAAQEVAVFSRLLQSQQVREFNIKVKILHTKVPIIKMIHNPSQVPVDVSFTNDGIDTSNYILDRLGRGLGGLSKFEENIQANQQANGMSSSTAPTTTNNNNNDDEAFAPAVAKLLRTIGRPLILMFKHLMHLWGLDDASVGGLGSFAQSLMVIFFVETQTSRYPADQQTSLFFNLLGFLHFYKEFDYQTDLICLNSRATFKKPSNTQLLIKNPLDPSGLKNAASACTCFPTISKRLEDAYTMLEQALSQVDVNLDASEALLDDVLGLSEKARFRASAEMLQRFQVACEDVEMTRQQRGMFNNTPRGRKMVQKAAGEKRRRKSMSGVDPAMGDRHEMLLAGAILGGGSGSGRRGGGGIIDEEGAHYDRHGVLPGTAPRTSMAPGVQQEHTDVLSRKKHKGRDAGMGVESTPQQRLSAAALEGRNGGCVMEEMGTSPASRNLFCGSYI